MAFIMTLPLISQRTKDMSEMQLVYCCHETEQTEIFIQAIAASCLEMKINLLSFRALEDQPQPVCLSVTYFSDGPRGREVFDHLTELC